MPWYRDPAVQKLIEAALVAILALVFGIVGAKMETHSLQAENQRLGFEVSTMREYLEETQPGYRGYRLQMQGEK